MIAATTLWEGQTGESLARRCGVARVEVMEATGSTLDVAHGLAEHGAPAGTVVVADAQRAGRGRQGRPWRSEPGQGVWCTVIERPADAAVLRVLSVRVGLNVAEGLDPYAGETVRVKWPNDLVLSTGKVGGILTETRWSGGAPSWVAIGVGVNVVRPLDVEGAAGLLPRTSRADVLEIIVRSARAAASDTPELSADELRRWRARDALVGRRVTSPTHGVVAGISADGALLIDAPPGISGGVRQEFRVGTIRFAEDT